MLTRREFAMTIGLAAATPLLPKRFLRPAAARQFTDVPLKVHELRPGAWALTEGGGNSLLIASKDAALLVDTKIASVGYRMVGQSTEVAGSAPAIVINTHHHADHIGGNYEFARATQFIAHVNLKPRIADTISQRIKPELMQKVAELERTGNADQAAALKTKAQALKPDDFAPDREFRDSHDLELGDHNVQLRHFGPGHTDNDTVVFIPELNIIHMGDLLFHEHHPFIDRPAGATTIGWQTSVRKAMELCDDQTIVIPGHGEISDKSALPRQIAYFDQMREIINNALKEGKSAEEIAGMKPEPFRNYGFLQLQRQAIANILAEMKNQPPQ